MTGNLNVDDHIEKLNAAKERRKKLMDFAKEGADAKKASTAKPSKKDPFKSYSARRTSINPADGLQYVDKLMIEVS